MDYKDLDYQYKLIDQHLAKADQCMEYGKFDDADVHIKAAKILFEGLKEQGKKIREYKLSVLAL